MKRLSERAGGSPLISLSKGFIMQRILVYAGKGFRIVAYTEDNGKIWEMMYERT